MTPLPIWGLTIICLQWPPSKRGRHHFRHRHQSNSRFVPSNLLNMKTSLGEKTVVIPPQGAGCTWVLLGQTGHSSPIDRLKSPPIAAIWILPVSGFNVSEPFPRALNPEVSTQTPEYGSRCQGEICSFTARQYLLIVELSGYIWAITRMCLGRHLKHSSVFHPLR